MLTCVSETYSGVSQTVFNCLAAKVKEIGIDVPAGTAGTISIYGVTASYTHDGINETLTVIVKDRPPTISCEKIAETVRHAVAACGGNP